MIVTMRRYLSAALVILFSIIFESTAFSQRITLEGLLDEAVTLSTDGKTAELAESLRSGSIAVQSEANTRGHEMKEKLLEQSKTLKGFASLASSGSLKKEDLVKTVSSIKLTVGANNINNLLSEGKEGLLGNAKMLNQSLALLKAGISALDGKQQSKLNSLISTAAESVTKLDDKNALAQMAAASAKRTLNKIVDLVKESI